MLGRYLKTSEEGSHGAQIQILKDSCQEDGSDIQIIQIIPMSLLIGVLEKRDTELNCYY